MVSWVESQTLAKKSVPFALNLLRELYPKINFDSIERNAEKGIVPDFIKWQNDPEEWKRAMSGFMFYSYSTILMKQIDESLEKIGHDENEKNSKELIEKTVDAITAWITAIRLLGEINRTVDCSVVMSQDIIKLVKYNTIMNSDIISKRLEYAIAHILLSDIQRENLKKIICAIFAELTNEITYGERLNTIKK